MFSGAEHLVQAFFVQLSAQLRLRPELSEIGEGLEEYGEIFSGMGWFPLVGPWIDRGRLATRILAQLLKRREAGAGGRRERLVKSLAALGRPIVVVLDDIDRLTTPEIRDVFKLVRLTASFPNVIYVVALDRVRVEAALAEDSIPGREYLEKIIQVCVDLPSIPERVLQSQVLEAIDGALKGIETPGPFDQDAWPDIFMEIIRPLVRHMRDVRRYSLAIQSTVRGLDGHVALADVLGLEAVRVFLPDVFSLLHDSVASLGTTEDPGYRRPGDSSGMQRQVEAMIAAGDAKGDVVRAVIKRLFPAAERLVGGSHFGSEWKSGWLRDRRVAHEDILRFYLERTAGEALRAHMAGERAFSLMDDQERLDGYLRSLDAEELEEVISSLEVHEDQYSVEHVVPGVIVLLNLLPDMPDRPLGMFDLGPRMVIGRVVYRLIRALKDPVAIEDAVNKILPHVTTLSAKAELITDVGHREGAGHQLVPHEVASGMERAWRTEVRAAPPELLAAEPDLLRLLHRTQREAEEGEPRLLIPNTPAVTLALLRSATHEVRRQTEGSRAVRRSPRLAWAELIELLGESDLKERVERLRHSEVAGRREVLDLADRYLSGWRPGPGLDD